MNIISNYIHFNTTNILNEDKEIINILYQLKTNNISDADILAVLVANRADDIKLILLNKNINSDIIDQINKLKKLSMIKKYEMNWI
jgi:hypothetical protein